MRRLGVLILWLLWRLLPTPALGRLGEALGVLLHALVPSRRRIGATNLALCFPEMSEPERAALLKAHFRAMGRASLLDTISWWGSREDVERLTRIEGEEHYLAQVRAGRPVIWLAPHFVGLNIGGVRVTAAFSPLVSLYSRIRNPHLDRLMLHCRTRFAAPDRPNEMYSRHDGIKPVLKAMRRGLPFYYLPDLDFGRKDALFVPFFGVPAATISGLPRLAKAVGAVVVPCITRRDGDGYVVRMYPAWEDFPSGDVEADTRRMNAYIEERIREMPEQYFWLHKRFKTRPEGEGSLYGRD
ncbi:MAG: lipid A biosynthesis acyltransferase [Pseudomonadota bacterium]